MPETIAYARTSTVEQTAGLADQVAELEAAGATKVFQEHISGTVETRPELERALDYAREGDTFVVTKPDRLARSVQHLLSIKEKLDKKQVSLKVLSMGLDTGNATGKLMLSVLASVAEFEREIMLERQRAGIAKAKAEGKYQGRPNSIDRDKVAALLADKVSPSRIAKDLGIGRDSVYRIKKELGVS
ncbi:recombinase family protein [Ahrensia marina]|uniref:Resolvase/invertase-type recombinase catalytic domain-containing protein n=1 Tax=Ahrensia marina TaxID=1514904 RepID=A0A0M9GP35_9HYPH|nr:recombinase family protein [Ahrensia marina]KPB02056.1 hypothetical protein SU32_04635 [Ahrensia marina]